MKLQSSKILRFTWFLGSLGVCFLFMSCEDDINFQVDAGPSTLVVDAWVTDEVGIAQTITLSRSIGYFEEGVPPAVTGAQVQIEDNEGNLFEFLDPNNNGTYIWEPEDLITAIGKVGNTYTLTIQIGEQTYQGFSEVKRVPEIDSLIVEFREESLGEPEGFYAELFARDLPGSGDTYWIRTHKNNEFLNRGVDINIAFDAGFSAGGNIDGLTFIFPIRNGVNPFREDDDGATLAPYDTGDVIDVEIYSITEDAFNFLTEVRTQLTNEGLFAVPVANVRTNIFNTDPNSDERVLGYFGASAVTKATRTVLVN